MPRDEKLKLKNRRARLDEAIEGDDMLVRKRSDMRHVDDDPGFGKEGGGKSGMDARRKYRPLREGDEEKIKEQYKKDFELETKILELKDKKKELLKGISGKSEKEKKEIRKKLEELNDKIMDLENE